MKKENVKSAKLLKSFEIGNKLANALTGGTLMEFPTSYTMDGDNACNDSCPDYKVDRSDGSAKK